MKRLRSRRWWPVMLGLSPIVALTLAGCGDSATAPGSELQIVATTTILGDVARNVAGDDATVTVLLPVGADPHDYQASSRQVAALQTADLVIANGLDLEEGLKDVLSSLKTDGANVFEIAELLSPLPFGGDGDLDPHVWHDPIRMAEAARLIGTQLAALDAGVDWAERAETYVAGLLAADQEIETILAAVPDEHRKLVTNHDAFGYLAARYHFEVVGTVIPAGTTLADPSSAELAALVGLIEQLEIPAIFAETTERSSLAEAIAAEIGAGIAVVDLHSGSLGEPGTEADTLIGMLVTNARRIAEALS